MKVAVKDDRALTRKLLRLFGARFFPALNNAMNVAANAVMRQWHRDIGASGSKAGWKREYQESLGISTPEPFVREVTAGGFGAQRVEEGVKRFDMKCIVQPKTPILTADGDKWICKIKKGDLVLSHNGKFKRVLNVFMEKNEEEWFYEIKTKESRVLCTANHPVLTREGWKRIDELAKDDEIMVLADRCNHCGKLLEKRLARRLGKNKKAYCDKSCAAKVSNIFRKESGRPDMGFAAREKIRNKVIETNRRLAMEGKHASQSGGKLHALIEKNRDKWGYAGLSEEKRKEYQHKASVALGKKSRGTDPETKMAEILLEIGQSIAFNNTEGANSIGKNVWIRQFLLKRNRTKLYKNGGERRRTYYLDFYNPFHKICIEVNGEHWHTKEQDEEKRDEIENEHGIAYLSFWSKEIYGNREGIKERLGRILANHEGKYLFTFAPFKVRKLRRNKHSYFSRYNMQVDGDESYIAGNAIVMHNSGLLNGPRARINAKGEPYNIVAFRHGTPGSERNPMPVSIYSFARRLTASETLGRYRVVGVMMDAMGVSGAVRQKAYSRFASRLPAGLARRISKEHAADPYAGMVKTGGPRHSQYVTFRVVSKKSTGWIYPGVPASPVFKSLEGKVRPRVRAILQEALARDLEGGLNYVRSNAR